MARVNVESHWWTDPRRSKLTRLVGDEDAADGAMMKAWRVAQEHWKRGKGLVPKEQFDALSHAEHIVAAGLADVREEFVYVRGSSEHHDWIYKQMQGASAAGKRSAEVRKQKTGSAQPKPNPSRTLPEPKPKVLELSYSSSFSKNKESPLTPKGVMDLWNRLSGRLPKATTLTKSRDRHARARLAENSDQAHWEAVIRAIEANPFCRGENDRGWVADFDYLLRPGTHIRVSEKLLTTPSKKTSDEIIAEVRANMLGEGGDDAP